jgi:HTH-type transcriptional regulator, pleiotropic regulator of extracellular virulence genes
MGVVQLDKIILGNEIKKLRKERKLTQKELAFGICNQSEISRLEKGLVFPSIDILHLIATKLKVPTFYFFEVLIHTNANYKTEKMNTILNLSQNKKYDEVFKLVKQELEMSEFHPEFKQFLMWHYYISAYYLKKISADTCLTELKLLLEKQHFGTDLLQDLYITNSIANIYGENSDYKSSIKYYQEILNASIDTKEYHLLTIKVLYNLSKSYYSNNQVDLSLSEVNKAIDISCKFNDMSLLGQLYYQKAQCLEELSYPDDSISQFYKKSLFFFELLNLSFYKEIVINKKKEYLGL